MRSRQIAQRLGVEEAHMLEFQQFNAMWDRKTSEYEERAAELLEAMRQRHELDAREQRHEQQAAGRPKHSSKLLDLRRIEVSLAKQGDYQEAQKVKVRADAMEKAEVARHTAHRTFCCAEGRGRDSPRVLGQQVGQGGGLGLGERRIGALPYREWSGRLGRGAGR